MRFLITDPCYVLDGEAYHEYLRWHDGETLTNEFTYRIEGVGDIIRSEHCREVSVTVGKNKEILSDSGLVVMIQLVDGFNPTEYNGTAVTSSRITANRWFERCEMWGRS